MATKSIRLLTTHGSCGASFGVCFIRMQVMPGTMSSTHAGGVWYDGLDTYTVAVGIQAFFVNKVYQVKSKVAAGLRSATDCQFIVSDQVTPTQFLTALVSTTPTEVERFIRSAPSKTSPLDLLPTSVLKACDAEVSKVISFIANRSFVVGRFPSVWKTGLVSPLL